MIKQTNFSNHMFLLELSSVIDLINDPALVYIKSLHSFYPPPKLRGGLTISELEIGGSRSPRFERGGCHFRGGSSRKGGVDRIFLNSIEI